LRAAEKSATAALIRDAGRDQVAGDLAQQVLREGAGTAEAKALQFEKVFGEAAHGDLSVNLGLKRAPLGGGAKRFPVTKVSASGPSKQISLR
jgi:hypothetical protein